MLDKWFHVAGLNIAAKLWGEQGGLPVIALHGWLDNAASFDALAEQLPHYHILAIDLPGHGLSDHKPPSGDYAIWGDLRCILLVADQMGWQNFTLIGHSRGAIIATLLSAARPERVDHLVCLDGLIPPPEDEANFPRQLGQYLHEYNKPPSKAGDRGHPDFEAAVTARLKVTPMTEKAAALIVERGTFKAENNCYYWRSDKRLKLASPIKLSCAQLQASINAISASAMLVAADKGMGKWLSTLPINIENRFEVHNIEGEHHCHMEAQASQIAQWIKGFISP
ncbi:alpha/beta fold hydrolase [Zhongshania aliphaticivorans]|uniref:alpha/beta fold hydrolase n=1 Tax=Zhongshania aliphaticivorans TaxID=1470434 RepID=UPI0013305ECF|nr:alpha/beta hydrolase [Zhongshania aliphaticivorans]